MKKIWQGEVKRSIFAEHEHEHIWNQHHPILSEETSVIDE